ncbi:uncharacterized protein [Aegilops tauschii subsp. strangulata]|uniref:uncharacterized protein isoform X1 n=1 Tax=Aegilops tauschii subsp. strangulata TaxID=200361 RepID=UPI001ABD0FE1|nr:L-lactate dehydrogenase 2-like isoform X1 [Aegilops tauschii subsp. strangulata]
MPPCMVGRASGGSVTDHATEAMQLVVPNPIDVLTYLAWKISEFPGCRVIGSDTNLHSSKSRFLIAEHLDINVQDVQEPPLHCLLFFALLFSVDHEVHICSKHLTAALPSLCHATYTTNRRIVVSQDRIGSGGRGEPRGTRSRLLARIDLCITQK